MTLLFSKKGISTLKKLSETKALYAFDFDGTLAGIVLQSTKAKMTSTTEKLLKKFSTQVPVAVISGRSILDLKKRIAEPPSYLIGNHGLEGFDHKKTPLALARGQKICKAWSKALQTMDLKSDIEIENKSFSLALHYRQSKNKKRAQKEILAALPLLTPPPQIITGKSVFNLLPPGSPNKGTALMDLLKKTKIKNVFFIGDDDTDEDVFSLSKTPGEFVTVRVGKKKSSKAQFFIQRQSDINRLLRVLIRFISIDGEMRENGKRRN